MKKKNFKNCLKSVLHTYVNSTWFRWMFIMKYLNNYSSKYETDKNVILHTYLNSSLTGI